MRLKAFLFKIRAIIMTVGYAGALATIPGTIAMAIAGIGTAYFVGNNQFATKVAIGYVGFPVFLVFFVWGLFKVPGFLRRAGLI
jgi:hypothetical protein